MYCLIAFFVILFIILFYSCEPMNSEIKFIIPNKKRYRPIIEMFEPEPIQIEEKDDKLKDAVDKAFDLVF